VQGSGFEVYGLGFRVSPRVSGAGFRVHGSGSTIKVGSGFRVQVFVFKFVQDLGFRV